MPSPLPAIRRHTDYWKVIFQCCLSPNFYFSKAIQKILWLSMVLMLALTCHANNDKSNLHIPSEALVSKETSKALDRNKPTPTSPPESEFRVEHLDAWQEIVRSSPYWVSKGTYSNLATIRRWVLFGTSYCENAKRHILFDRRAKFLGYLDDANSPLETQNLLNVQRQKIAAENRTKTWLPGNLNATGYPFAISCNQPHADLQTALDRYSGKNDSAKLWGTWDGMRIGEENNKVSLHKAINLVYQDRLQRKHISLPEDVLATLAGTILIESGGRARAHSAADARGILQLSLAALRDCNLAEKFHFHRMAQIDCALQLLEQNHRNLAPTVATTFGNLNKAKFDKLYSLLLIQAYHGGVGRVNSLMTDSHYNKASLYFAKHHERYSAEDIALGMVFHNLGRNKLGFNSLYYVTDVGIATELICKEYSQLPGCI